MRHDLLIARVVNRPGNNLGVFLFEDMICVRLEIHYVESILLEALFLYNLLENDVYCTDVEPLVDFKFVI
jgi:hypothetical protein